MTPNVSVLLQRWQVADVIGRNLVRFEELNMRRKDGTKVGHTKIHTIERALGRPWWVVHRAHLHEGLSKVAERLGVQIHINSRIVKVNFEREARVTVETHRNVEYTFDLVVGADGLNSIVRRTLFPDVSPEPPTTNCAYRANVPYERIRKDSLAKELVEKLTMEVWMAPNSYIITYPICDGKDLNLVLSHHRPQKLRKTENDVPIEELRNQYKDFDPRIKRIVDMIPETVSVIIFVRCRGHKLISEPVSLATFSHRTIEDLVLSTEKCCSDGGCCTFYGQSHGTRRSYFHGRWCVSC